MPFIETIGPDRAEGELKQIYDELLASRGRLASVHTIQSLNPESITRHMDLYMTLMFGKSPLSRECREMLAVVVSSANRCPYCIAHHSQALLHHWKDPERVRALVEDFTTVDLDGRDELLCALADALTREPSGITEVGMIAPLKETGNSDRAILDAVLVISYFNFVNRIVMGLGVELEDHGGEGFSFE